MLNGRCNEDNSLEKNWEYGQACTERGKSAVQDGLKPIADIVRNFDRVVKFMREVIHNQTALPLLPGSVSILLDTILALKSLATTPSPDTNGCPKYPMSLFKVLSSFVQWCDDEVQNYKKQLSAQSFSKTSNEHVANHTNGFDVISHNHTQGLHLLKELESEFNAYVSNLPATMFQSRPPHNLPVDSSPNNLDVKMLESTLYPDKKGVKVSHTSRDLPSKHVTSPLSSNCSQNSTTSGLCLDEDDSLDYGSSQSSSLFLTSPSSIPARPSNLKNFDFKSATNHGNDNIDGVLLNKFTRAGVYKESTFPKFVPSTFNRESLSSFNSSLSNTTTATTTNDDCSLGSCPPTRSYASDRKGSHQNSQIPPLSACQNQYYNYPSPQTNICENCLTQGANPVNLKKTRNWGNTPYRDVTDNSLYDSTSVAKSSVDHLKFENGHVLTSKLGPDNNNFVDQHFIGTQNEKEALASVPEWVRDILEPGAFKIRVKSPKPETLDQVSLGPRKQLIDHKREIERCTITLGPAKLINQAHEFTINAAKKQTDSLLANRGCTPYDIVVKAGLADQSERSDICGEKLGSEENQAGNCSKVRAEAKLVRKTVLEITIPKDCEPQAVLAAIKAKLEQNEVCEPKTSISNNNTQTNKSLQFNNHKKFTTAKNFDDSYLESLLKDMKIKLDSPNGPSPPDFNSSLNDTAGTLGDLSGLKQVINQLPYPDHMIDSLSPTDYRAFLIDGNDKTIKNTKSPQHSLNGLCNLDRNTVEDNTCSGEHSLIAPKNNETHISHDANNKTGFSVGYLETERRDEPNYYLNSKAYYFRNRCHVCNEQTNQSVTDPSSNDHVQHTADEHDKKFKMVTRDDRRQLDDPTRDDQPEHNNVVNYLQTMSHYSQPDPYTFFRESTEHFIRDIQRYWDKISSNRALDTIFDQLCDEDGPTYSEPLNCHVDISSKANKDAALLSPTISISHTGHYNFDTDVDKIDQKSFTPGAKQRANTLLSNVPAKAEIVESPVIDINNNFLEPKASATPLPKRLEGKEMTIQRSKLPKKVASSVLSTQFNRVKEMSLPPTPKTRFNGHYATPERKKPPLLSPVSSSAVDRKFNDSQIPSNCLNDSQNSEQNMDIGSFYCDDNRYTRLFDLEPRTDLTFKKHVTSSSEHTAKAKESLLAPHNTKNKHSHDQNTLGADCKMSKIVRSGTLNALLVYATCPTKNDFLFQEAFILTYRNYLTPEKLIGLLTQRLGHLLLVARSATSGHERDQKEDRKKAIMVYERAFRCTFSFLFRVIDDLSPSECKRDPFLLSKNGARPLDSIKSVAEILLAAIDEMTALGETKLASLLRDKFEQKRNATTSNITDASKDHATSSYNTSIDYRESASVPPQMTDLPSNYTKSAGIVAQKTPLLRIKSSGKRLKESLFPHSHSNYNNVTIDPIEISESFEQTTPSGDFLNALRKRSIARHKKRPTSPVHQISCPNELIIGPPEDLLLTFKSKELAEQMTLLDWKLFTNLPASECLMWALKRDESLTPHLAAFTKHFNDVSYWCRTYLLTHPTSDASRVRYFRKFLKIMRHLEASFGNFNAVLALLSGLDSSPVSRLVRPCDHHNEKHIGQNAYNKSDSSHTVSYKNNELCISTCQNNATTNISGSNHLERQPSSFKLLPRTSHNSGECFDDPSNQNTKSGDKFDWDTNHTRRRRSKEGPIHSRMVAIGHTDESDLEHFRRLVDSSGSFKNYRKMLSTSEPPCIPYIGLVLQDLTFIDVGNPNYLNEHNLPEFDAKSSPESIKAYEEPKIINFTKCWQFFTILQGIRRFKEKNYKIKPNPKILKFFNDFQEQLPEETLWHISESIRPRRKSLY